MPSPARAQDANEPIGAGTLRFVGKDGLTSEAPRVHTAVRMEVTGIIARVEVKQRFHNPGTGWVEGLYAFPLPENAAVDRLRMQIGERLVVGEIREKAEAQKLYEQARDSGKRASVVHQNRPNLFRTAVANIGPGESISVIIGYLQIVDQDAGRYSLRFPLTIRPRYLPRSHFRRRHVGLDDRPIHRAGACRASERPEHLGPWRQVHGDPIQLGLPLPVRRAGAGDA